MKVILIIILGIAYIFFSHKQDIKSPNIKHGEFPFEIKYEINNEINKICDTLICDFDGFKSIGEAGTIHKWKSYLASGKERVVLFSDDEIEIYFDPGTPQYYMGDEFSPNKYPRNFKDLSCIKKNKDGTIVHSAILEKDLFAKYKIRVLEWKISEPIQNSYE